ncbi:UTP--glucose-1-phosphate uridylyltransferase GalU [Rickettsiales endosymbiont of Stachyamoeba lipophora]|uniref:UTP--glucose-1-phosphate uridylyltransferase GalU n=1 Tax=Rickettsiales endosymbiont of Stachyamoeba lipophora TaxID=2486578 RepID=UPI000F650512|nr:UTP--glucose-1-phosphate uridylyltransferase GalU [Rickettsiales endosymbiont of Stachyamoeba lipophora]AZL15402.1 UTP--glucose-1-phosphate uridylyltransferase [Rickettsiales endosymbiont of Stachyamoeba lipophora]
MPKPIKKVVFPVGGLGTRFLPATKSLPKEMLPVASKPIIQYAYEEARDAEMEQFIFITGRNKNAITNHFDHAYELESVLSDTQKEEQLKKVKAWLPEAGNIAFIRQQEPLGLGHAVWCARSFVQDEPFAVILADEMLKIEGGFLKKMIEAYNILDANIIATFRVAKEDVDRYGIVNVVPENGFLRITEMIEKPAIHEARSNLAIVGRYILKPEIFEEIARFEKGKNGEIQLTDAMQNLLKTQKFYALEFQAERFDCGNQLGYLEANIAYMLENPEFTQNVKEIIKKYI